MYLKRITSLLVVVFIHYSFVTEEGNKGCKDCSLWTAVVVFKEIFPYLVCKSNACLLLEMHVTVRIQQRFAKSSNNGIYSVYLHISPISQFYCCVTCGNTCLPFSKMFLSFRNKRNSWKKCTLWKCHSPSLQNVCICFEMLNFVCINAEVEVVFVIQR